MPLGAGLLGAGAKSVDAVGIEFPGGMKLGSLERVFALRRSFVPRLLAAAEALLPFRVTWLAPVTEALMLMCVLFNQRYGPALSAAMQVIARTRL